MNSVSSLAPRKGQQWNETVEQKAGAGKSKRASECRTIYRCARQSGLGINKPGSHVGECGLAEPRRKGQGSDCGMKHLALDWMCMHCTTAVPMEPESGDSLWDLRIQ